MKKIALLPSLLIALASLLFLYSRVPDYMPPGEIIRPLIIIWLVLHLLLFPACWVTRDWDWAGLLLVIIVLGFFSSTLFAYAFSVTVLLALGVLWMAFRLLLGRKFGMRHVYRVLNVVSLIAISLSLFSLYPILEAIPYSYYSYTLPVIESNRYVELNPGMEIKPDIYYIVLDGYGRSDILRELYEFDNSEFLGFLGQQGFIVPGKSLSNYPKTVLSVASTMNMDYVQELTPGLESSNTWWLMSPWVDYSLVRTSLERIGYSSVSISTDWNITDNPTTDYYFKSHPVILSEFERYLLGVTPLKYMLPVIQNLATAPDYNSHRRSQLYNFDALEHIPEIHGPKFVFAHIILPHPPFVFSSDGAPKDPEYSYTLNDADAVSFPDTPGQYRDHYVDQVVFLNGHLEQVIHTILENSETPPIIILQADHGPRMLTDSLSSANTCLPETYSVFSAYYLPGIEPGDFPEDLSAVNLFRIIFNEYFDASLPLLKNAQYFPRLQEGGYNFEDVTGGIGGRQNCAME